MSQGWTIWWLISMLLVAGCSRDMEKPTLEDLGMIGVMGFDYVSKDQVKVTVAFPQPSEEAKETAQKLTTVVELTQQAPVVLSKASERSLSLTQLRTVLISEEYARKIGVRQIVENLYRDPKVGDTVFLAIVKGSVEDLIKADYPDKPNVTVFLNDLLHPRGETAFSPFTTIHGFIHDLTDEISDPTIPYIEKIDKDVKITKIALFQGDRMVGGMTPEEAKVVQSLRHRTELPNFKIPIKEGAKDVTAVLNFVQSKAELESNGDLKHPEVKIEIKLTGSILQYTGSMDLEDPSNRAKLERLISQSIKDDTYDMLKKFQRMEIDPLTLGETFRRKYRGQWTKDKWIEAFKQMKFDVHVRTEIVNTGTIK